VINYGFGQAGSNPKDSWRYMYYFAGSLTIVWGIVLLFVLPPDPVRAKGFKPKERYIMVARLESNNSGVRNTHLKGAQVIELLLDVKFWLMFSWAFLGMIANGKSRRVEYFLVLNIKANQFDFNRRNLDFYSCHHQRFRVYHFTQLALVYASRCLCWYYAIASTILGIQV
jgi:MFS family permease